MLKENKFLVLKEKGRSGRISTYLVEDNVTGERAYLKTFKGEEQQAFSYITEMNCLKDANVQGILTHLEAGIMEEESGYYMLFSEVGGPTLEDFLEMGAPLTESEALRIAAELMSMLKGLHENDCMHLFLCARNIFYSPGKPLVVKDPALTVGMYELIIEEIEGLDYSGLSPGLMDGEEPTEQDDMYALGALMEKVGERAEWTNEERRADFLKKAEFLMSGVGERKGSGCGQGSSERDVREDHAVTCASECTGIELKAGERSGAAGSPGRDGENEGFRPDYNDDLSDVIDEDPNDAISTHGDPSPVVRVWMNEDAGCDAGDTLGVFAERRCGAEGRAVWSDISTAARAVSSTEAPRNHGERHSGEPIREDGNDQKHWRAAPLDPVAIMGKDANEHLGRSGKGGAGRTRRLIALGAAVAIAALVAFTASFAGGAGPQVAGVSQTQDETERRDVGVMQDDGSRAEIAATPVSLAELMAGKEKGQSEAGGPAAAATDHESAEAAVPPTEEPCQQNQGDEGYGVVKAANQPPRASFTVSPPQGPTPLQVCLDASASADPDGRIVSYSWSCGGSGPRVLRVFESPVIPASISVTLTVTDDRGASSSTTRTITLY